MPPRGHRTGEQLGQRQQPGMELAPVRAQVLGREPESGRAQAPTGSAQGEMGKEVLWLVLRAEQEPSPW